MKAGRAYVRFLEREVYTFAGSRRNAAGPHFLFMGGPQKTTWTAGSGPAADGGTRVGSWAEQYKRNDTREVRRKGKKVISLLLGGKIGGVFACPPGGSGDRA